MVEIKLLKQEEITLPYEKDGTDDARQQRRSNGTDERRNGEATPS
ncbi:uncharacterized protein G2W53_014231 [Senna tora]|uniref:Uncharacterized protein n=1 Tax=Senna tora TaxID=362788 RepID=A0A834WT53_9FABA|nr:uncharacterized protein G2W53_014231 [Senna tora]